MLSLKDEPNLQDALQSRYPELLNKEMVIAEIKRRGIKTKETRSRLERYLLHTWGLASFKDSEKREIAVEAELELLEKLVKAHHPEDPETFRRELKQLLLKQRLAAFRVPTDKIDSTCALIEMGEKHFQESLALLNAYELPEGLPEQFKLSQIRKLPAKKEHFVEKALFPLLDQFKEETPQALEQALQEKKGCLLAVFSSSIAKKLKPELTFFHKWNSHLKVSFTQGAEDLNEALSDGVCFSIASRWAASEAHHKTATAAEVLGQLGITPQDRFLQAYYATSLGRNACDNLTIFETPRFKKLLKVDRVVDAKAFQSIDAFSLSNGVQLFASDGHQMYYRCQEGVYRFGDPNYGIFEFQTQEQLALFIRDLMETFYPGSPIFTAKLEV